MEHTKQYMTLRELRERVGSTKGIRRISMAQIAVSGKPLEIYESDDYQILVYPIGFALAKSGRRMTAVRIDECGDYTYDCDLDFPKPGEENVNPNFLSVEYFLDQPWPIRIMMEADDQFQKNEDSREGKWICKHAEIADDKNWMLGGYYSFEDALIARMEKEEMLKSLTEKQRKVFHLYYEKGYTQEETADKLKIGRTTVKHHIEAILTNLRKRSVN